MEYDLRLGGPVVGEAIEPTPAALLLALQDLVGEALKLGSDLRTSPTGGRSRKAAVETTDALRTGELVALHPRSASQTRLGTLRKREAITFSKELRTLKALTFQSGNRTTFAQILVIVRSP